MQKKPLFHLCVPSPLERRSTLTAGICLQSCRSGLLLAGEKQNRNMAKPSWGGGGRRRQSPPSQVWRATRGLGEQGDGASAAVRLTVSRWVLVAPQPGAVPTVPLPSSRRPRRPPWHPASSCSHRGLQMFLIILTATSRARHASQTQGLACFCVVVPPPPPHHPGWGRGGSGPTRRSVHLRLGR